MPETNPVVAEVETDSDEIEVYGRSCTRRRKFVIIQQIDNFPLHLEHGDYVSPTYYDKSVDCSWGLTLTTNSDGDIKIGLQHDEYEGKHLYVGVYLTVVDSFGWSSFHSYKKIDFQLNSHQILMQVTTKELLCGYCGLNRKRFLPNDTLTLKCEITTFKTFEKVYINEENNKVIKEKTEIPKNYVKKWIFIWLIVLLAKFFFVVTILSATFYFTLIIVTPFVERIFAKPLMESVLARNLTERILAMPFIDRILAKPLTERILATPERFLSSDLFKNILGMSFIKYILPQPLSIPRCSYVISASAVCLFFYVSFNILRRLFVYLWYVIKPGGDRTYIQTPEIKTATKFFTLVQTRAVIFWRRCIVIFRSPF